MVMEKLRRCVTTIALALGIGLLAGCWPFDDDDPEPPPAATAPAITTQPAQATVTDGQSASFTAAASGTGPLTYQWQRGGSAIAGATSATYTLASATLADSGVQFRVVVTNAAGSATSNAVVLTVNPAPTAPSITGQPVGTTVTAGTPATFSVAADGTGPLSYQWQRDGVDIAGATAATYSLPAPGLADTGATFRAKVSNNAGTLTSGEALLTVVADAVLPPTITAQPGHTSTLDGSSAALSVGVTGTGPFSYQWRKGGSPIAGATASSYATPSLALADSGAVYAVVVTNGGGSATSADATVTVNPRPVSFAAAPAAATVASGQTASFAVTADGSAPLTYQWLRNGNTVAGATAATYTTPALAAADSGALYSVRVTNAAGNLTSGSALLTVTATAAAPSIATQPASLAVTEGLPAAFTVSATGTGTLSYVWRRNGVNISGATSASYTLPSTAMADNTARFSVVVTNATGSATSGDAVLTVQAATGPLIGRAWATPQALEENTSTVSVLDRRAGIDDTGHVTVLFRKNNGTRDVLYAMRGTPNAAGQTPAWTVPTAIDLLGATPVSSMGTSEDYGLVVAPGGNALAWWYHSANCSAATYSTSGKCRYYYVARYTVSSGVWGAPELIGDAPSPGFKVFFNDRGDIALIGKSWVRRTASTYTSALALFMRNPSEATFRRQLLNTEPIGSYQLGMDGAGNLMLAAEYEQNATTDMAVLRGTVASGLGAAQVLDGRGAAVTFANAAVGLNGQQVITWTQNNGAKNTTYAATGATATAAFTVTDLDRLLASEGNDRYLLITDGGEALYYDFANHRRQAWTVAAGWSTVVAMPPTLPSNYYYTSYAHNRRGDLLALGDGKWYAFQGRSATYDASRNVLVLPWPSETSGPAFVLGVDKYAGYSAPVLSMNGIGFTAMLINFDVMPTPAAPAGDGRAVDNLWGAFLK
jgi:hypothetical protein